MFQPRFFRSTAVRFGFVYAVLFALSTLALVGFVWWETAGLMQRQTEAAIDLDFQWLVARYTSGSATGLAESMDQRLNQNESDDAIYLLVDAELRRIDGNLGEWPSAIDPNGPGMELTLPISGIPTRTFVKPFVLDEYRLLIGRDVESRTTLRDLLSNALLSAAGIVVVLGSLGALAVRSVFRIAIADVSATAAAVSSGDLSRRVRVTGEGDEFDRLAEAINDMLDRIGRLMDGVRQVSNAIAHDLRTPIARARARLEDAARHAMTEADLRAAIERAQADLDGVVSVFQALLRIAEIEAGSRRSAFAPVDLAPLLHDLADLYGALAEENGVRLVADIPPTAPAFGDRDMLQQAVANLLDNAIKFSPSGSTIRIELRSTPPLADAPGGIAIIVADGGPGIPEADRARATERFFRGELARHTPGSGLGLALVQAVATLHGGVLQLEDNHPGLAAIITLTSQAPPADAKHAIPTVASAA